MGLHDDPVATLVACLQASGFDPQSTGPDSWKSRCPAHNGRRHNLSVKKGDDGQALVYCHHAPGCDLAAILASLGMTMAELFPPDAGRDKHGANGKPKAARRAHRTPEAALAKTIEKRGKPTRHWVYRNADGSEAMRVYRFDFVDPEASDPDKEYRPVHHTAAGWVLGDPPGPLPLYHLPDLPDAPTVYRLYQK